MADCGTGRSVEATVEGGLGASGAPLAVGRDAVSAAMLAADGDASFDAGLAAVVAAVAAAMVAVDRDASFGAALAAVPDAVSAAMVAADGDASFDAAGDVCGAGTAAVLDVRANAAVGCDAAALDVAGVPLFIAAVDVTDGSALATPVPAPDDASDAATLAFSVASRFGDNLFCDADASFETETAPDGVCVVTTPVAMLAVARSRFEAKLTASATDRRDASRVIGGSVAIAGMLTAATFLAVDAMFLRTASGTDEEPEALADATPVALVSLASAAFDSMTGGAAFTAETASVADEPIPDALAGATRAVCTVAAEADAFTVVAAELVFAATSPAFCASSACRRASVCRSASSRRCDADDPPPTAPAVLTDCAGARSASDCK